jgi:5-methylcytosine-specific restriction endonuclease McrA
VAQANPRRTNGARRTKLIKRVRREEDTCWLCGEPVDVTLPPRLPASPEVHEVIPVGRGGDPYDRANCHLTHRVCNQKQGNRLEGEPVAPSRVAQQGIETSRTW